MLEYRGFGQHYLQEHAGTSEFTKKKEEEKMHFDLIKKITPQSIARNPLNIPRSPMANQFDWRKKKLPKMY